VSGLSWKGQAGLLTERAYQSNFGTPDVLAKATCFMSPRLYATAYTRRARFRIAPRRISVAFWCWRGGSPSHAANRLKST